MYRTLLLLFLAITALADADLKRAIKALKANAQRRLQWLQPQGIVFNAHGANGLLDVLATVELLRNELNCKLPVEVMYMGQAEYSAKYGKALQALPDVSVLDLSKMPSPTDGRTYTPRSYSIKVYSLLLSSFKEVLMLDSDSLPLQDPTRLFQSREFKRSGCLFWPDLHYAQHLTESGYTYFGLNSPYASEGPYFREAESGQLMFSRERLSDVLEALWLLHSYPEFSTHFSGDKDTYRLAFAVMDKLHEYRQHPVGPRLAVFHDHAISQDQALQPGTQLHFSAQVQNDLRGAPMFFHRAGGRKTDARMSGPALRSHIGIDSMYVTLPTTVQWANVTMQHQWPFVLKAQDFDFDTYHRVCTPSRQGKLAFAHCEFDELDMYPAMPVVPARDLTIYRVLDKFGDYLASHLRE